MALPPTVPLPPPPGPIDAESARRFRDALSRAEFDQLIFRTLGIIGPPGWRASIREKLPRLPTFACWQLCRFFVVRDPMPPELLAEVIGGAEVLAALERAGIAVKQSDGLYRCAFQFSPGAGVYTLSDAIEDPSTATPPDEYIIPVSGSTRCVDDLTVREPCELALDIACGQGFHAQRAMTHARRCIATDINPRALAFARANAAILGELDRMEFRQGSFFEPVADVAGKVDLITCNPPYLIQPGMHLTAAVTESEGDSMLEGLVRALPAMLREGAWCTVIGLWENPSPQDWHSRVRPWLERSGCQALILEFQTYRPEEYLATWFPPDVRASMQSGWQSLCERRKIGAVTYGGVILRKTSPHWIGAVSTAIFARSGAASHQVKAMFETRTALNSMWGPADLLDRKLRVAPGWRFDPAQGLPRSAPAGISRGLAIPLSGAANWEPLLVNFDGGAPAREVLKQLHAAGRLRLPPDHPEAAAMLMNLVQGACLDIVA